MDIEGQHLFECKIINLDILSGFIFYNCNVIQFIWKLILVNVT